MDANTGETAIPEDSVPLRRLSFASESDGASEQSLLLDEDLDLGAAEGAWEEALPPQDRGAGAWKVLLGCWLLEISWGKPRDWRDLRS